MLILILIDVQYSQEAKFLIPPVERFPPSLTAIWKTLPLSTIWKTLVSGMRVNAFSHGSSAVHTT